MAGRESMRSACARFNGLPGVKNATALQYHFGDRAGLLTAVFEKHSYDVELRRQDTAGSLRGGR